MRVSPRRSGRAASWNWGRVAYRTGKPELGPDRHPVLIALRARPTWKHQVGRTRLRRFSAAPTNSRRGGDTAPSYDSSVRRRTPRVHRNRRGTRTVVEGRASIVTSPGGTAAPGSWIHHVGVLNADRVLVRRRRPRETDGAAMVLHYSEVSEPVLHAKAVDPAPKRPRSSSAGTMPLKPRLSGSPQ